jgi:hypothetical protein
MDILVLLVVDGHRQEKDQRPADPVKGAERVGARAVRQNGAKV